MKTANKTLKTLQSKEIFVDIYTDNFGNSFYGFIRNFNEIFLLLEHYNDDGIYNLGYWFSVALPFLIPILIMVEYFTCFANLK